MPNHHMNTLCPECGGIKDNRAILCKNCFLATGLARKGTGNYGNMVRGGYLLVYRPNHCRADKDGYVKNSIIVWEEANKQEVPAGFHVHHADRDRLNDVPDNLMAVSPSDHIKIHEIWRWHRGS